MALSSGTLAITVEFAQGLKDHDWFGKQDPYAVVKCGTQTFRTKTAVDAGKNPVWNETFTFNVINENSIEISIMDSDAMSRDDLIGSTSFSLAKAREQGSDRLQAPVVSAKSHKHRGHVSVRLVFTSNDSLKKAEAKPAAAPVIHQQPQVVYAMAPQQPMPAPYPYTQAHPIYAQPAAAPAPYPYAAAPAPYGYAPAPTGPVVYMQQRPC